MGHLVNTNVRIVADADGDLLQLRSSLVSAVVSRFQASADVLILGCATDLADLFPTESGAALIVRTQAVVLSPERVGEWAAEELVNLEQVVIKTGELIQPDAPTIRADKVLSSAVDAVATLVLGALTNAASDSSTVVYRLVATASDQDENRSDPIMSGEVPASDLLVEIIGTSWPESPALR